MSSKRASLGQRADGLLSVAANRTAQTLTGKTEREVTRLPIAKIRRDGGTQPRAGLDQAVVEEYAEVIRDGGALPAVEVVHDGTDYWLWDGYHRLAAAEQEGETEYDCFVTPGTRRDAVLKSVGANADHGLRRTDDDKRRAVEVLLADPEWSQWSDREIARQCKVSHPFVAKIRSKRAESTGNHFQLRGKKAQKRIGRDGKARDVSNIQAANQRRAEERQAQDEPGKTAQANAKLAAKIDELREAVLAVVKGRAPMTYREIEFAVNAYLGRIANPGLLSGAINVLTRNGSLRSVGGGRYALPGAEPVQQNGSDWLDTPVERGATPAMAIAANGAPSDNRYQMGEPEPEATGWLDQPVERETPGVAQRDNTSIEYESDEAMAARLAELLRVGSHVLCDLEDVLEQTAPVPEWVLSKLDDLSKLLHGHPGQDDVWNPGLNSLLADLNTRSRRERE